MDSFLDEFKKYCEELRKKERAKCARLNGESVKLPKVNIHKYERNLDNGMVAHKIVGFNLSIKEATLFLKACHSASIKIGDELIFTRWYEML
jgi:hypothetical protein